MRAIASRLIFHFVFVPPGFTPAATMCFAQIHEVRSLINAMKDREGRPVDTVRIMFAQAWMARRERRPLLDVDAHVFFMDRKTGSDVEIKTDHRAEQLRGATACELMST